MGSASNGAGDDDGEVWISLLKREEGPSPPDTYKSYRIPITEAFTVVGVHAIPTTGIHHMKLKIRRRGGGGGGGGGGDREFFGYDGISTVCPPPPLRFAELTAGTENGNGNGNVGETLGPGDEWVLEIHNREPMEGGEEVGFKVLTVPRPLPGQRTLVNDSVGVVGFTLPPGRERITVGGAGGGGGAAGGEALNFAVPGDDCALLAIHGHFHRRGVEQAFFLNGEEVGRWSAEQARGECPAPPAYRPDAAVVLLGGRAAGRGDVVSTACTYDTSNNAEAVVEGLTAEDEMCTAFLVYRCGATEPAATARHERPREGMRQGRGPRRWRGSRAAKGVPQQ